MLQENNWTLFLKNIPQEIQNQCLQEWKKAVPSAKEAVLEWKIGYGYREIQEQLQLNLSVKINPAQALQDTNLSFLEVLSLFFEKSTAEDLEKINPKLEELLQNTAFELSVLPTLYLDSQVAVSHLILRAKLNA